MTEWYERSFGEDYLLVYKHRDVQGAKREVHTMISWLGLPAGANVLDLCCGMGRHSMALVEAGYKVTGIDLSDVLLREAHNHDPEGRVTWLKGDMRKLPLEGGFDAVVNLFSSFGYFEEDTEHIKVLKEIRRVLKPGGQFIIDFLNPSYTVKHLVPHSERVDEGQQITEERSIQDGYVKKHIEIQSLDSSSSDEPRRYLERIKLYNREDFTEMLTQSGLQLEHVYGGYGNIPYDPEVSSRMIMVGRAL